MTIEIRNRTFHLDISTLYDASDAQLAMVVLDIINKVYDAVDAGKAYCELYFPKALLNNTLEYAIDYLYDAGFRFDKRLEGRHDGCGHYGLRELNELRTFIYWDRY